MITFMLPCHLWVPTTEMEYSSILVSLILFERLQLFLQRSGKESLTQASLYLLYFVSVRIRQPVIGPQFPTSQIFWDWGPGPLAAPSGYATGLS